MLRIKIYLLIVTNNPLQYKINKSPPPPTNQQYKPDQTAISPLPTAPQPQQYHYLKLNTEQHQSQSDQAISLKQHRNRNKSLSKEWQMKKRSHRVTGKRKPFEPPPLKTGGVHPKRVRVVGYAFNLLKTAGNYGLVFFIIYLWIEFFYG